MLLRNENAESLLGELKTKYGEVEAYYEVNCEKVFLPDNEEPDEDGEFLGYKQWIWVLTEKALVEFHISPDRIKLGVWIRNNIISYESEFEISDRYPYEKLINIQIKTSFGEIIKLEAPEEEDKKYFELVNKLV